MTAAEAIKRIQVHMEVHRIGRHPHTLIGEALDKAIEALRKMQRLEDLKPLIIDAKAALEVNQLLDEIKHLKPTICTADEEVEVVDRRWIPVAEKLPKDGEQVLCWYEYFRYGNYNRLYQTYGIGYQFHGNWGGEVSNGHKCRVIAWMPLPAPLKEEE